MLGTSPPTLVTASPVLLAASSTRSSASSEFEVNCRRATEVVLVRVGLKPTLTVHVPDATAGLASLAGVVGSSATAALRGASGPTLPVPKQFWLTIWKSAAVALPPSSASAATVMLVIVSGASPSLVTTTGTWLAAAAVPAATEANTGGEADSVGAGGGPPPLIPVLGVGGGVLFVGP